MRRSTGWLRLGLPHGAGLLLILLSAAACGSKRPATQQVLVPPRLDLRQHGRVGLILFTLERAKGDLDAFATRRFSENILAAQPGVEVLELGSVDSVRQRVGETQYGPATVQALGRARRVPAVVFVGHLKVSDVTPSGGLRGLSLPRVEAKISAQLTVALYSTESGGTLWRASGTASRKVGGLSIVGGDPVFSARDPNSEYARMVTDLVDYVANDLRATWQTQ